MLQALEAGEIQGRIAAVADQRAQDLARGRAVLVGINRYANTDEEPPPVERPDLGAIRERRIEELQRMREAGRRPAGAETGGGSQPEASASERSADDARTPDGSGQDAVWEAIIDAATKGATVGELTRELRAGAGEGPRAVALVAHRAAEPFETLRGAVLAKRSAAPAAARVFLCCLGDVARYRPRLDFTRGFFAIGGFFVEDSESFAAPGPAASAAQSAGASIVVIVGRDETYAEQAAETARLVKSAADPPVVVLAGRPKPLVAELQAAGVDSFIHQRSDVLEVLGDLARQCGVTL
jgi:methylmalonyl-CoA mutase